MSIFEVTNLETGDVELVEAKDERDLRSYFPHVKIAALDPSEHVQVVYYLSGACHNDNGPAVTWSDGDQQWWIKDKLHNEHGPAVVYSNGTKQWWINGKWLTEEEFNEYLRSNKS